MTCAVWHGVNDLRLEDRPVQEPQGREVLIRVAACGVCGTDLHLLDGSVPLYRPPRVLGHEIAGTVLAVGSECKSVGMGDRVAVDPSLSCGACFFCREAQPYFCADRTPVIGGFGQYLMAPEQTVYRLPDGLPLQHGALAEPLSCCLHALERASLDAGGTVAVIGAGTIGLLMLQLARRSGAALVAVSEPNPQRRGLALRLGADLAINPLVEDVSERLLEATDGIGVDCAFEAAGAAETVALSLSLPRRGGSVVLVGVAPANAEITVRPYDLFERELTVSASFIRGHEFRRAVALLPVLDIESLLGRRFPLTRIHDAFSAAASQRGVKTLVMPNESNESNED